jgi:hypothetical protein
MAEYPKSKILMAAAWTSGLVVLLITVGFLREDARFPSWALATILALLLIVPIRRLLATKPHQ